tara:strand:+ start:694 stop:1635 length:942 start_codon:yes stop_codon:yes gene_type:complete
LADQVGVVNDSYRYGDLYRLSNLSAFKAKHPTCEKYQPIAHYESKKPVHLFIIGDSFTEKERIGKENFAGATYHYTHWSQILHFKPDTSAINIVILETVERHFREKFTNSPIGNVRNDSATFNATSETPLVYELDQLFRASSSESRFDQLLFQNDFSLKIKEAKANFNYKFFDRVNKEVTLVNHGKDIVYYMDTDVPNITSSFTELPDSTVNAMVNNLNESELILKKLGFDNVLLSVIPNKVSVVDPTYAEYNQLIPKITQHPKLKMDVINIFTEFQKMGSAAYLISDSHWTCEAQNRWIKKANEAIYNLVRK